ncbi:acyl dehydratase [Pseudomonas sp. PDM28]|uniref:MaoC/PaaZ C-terminal domain-containing protein n=1 Tax=Pseudomonas sp. PDM28 TaxID=2854770 RepID=UPI001C467B69|nr:MaoC/PaaZ C-terminal domain-containing protein [Pseudomonas sp. PDM28]MBV7551486.1 acyl dehydratase [Pseudomonas sp. PDM28]
MSGAPTLHFEDIGVGQSLPTLRAEVTTSSIVVSAMATRDFHPIHHDLDKVRELGHSELFLNIFASNAYAERFVSQWAGSEARLSKMSIRLGAPCYAGNTLRIEGTVSDLGGAPMRWVEVEIRAYANEIVHASGVVRLEWP